MMLSRRSKQKMLKSYGTQSITVPSLAISVSSSL
jgi:hypothetical protein